jgi:hypothetical protein
LGRQDITSGPIRGIVIATGLKESPSAGGSKIGGTCDGVEQLAAPDSVVIETTARPCSLLVGVLTEPHAVLHRTHTGHARSCEELCRIIGAQRRACRFPHAFNLVLEGRGPIISRQFLGNSSLIRICSARRAGTQRTHGVPRNRVLLVGDCWVSEGCADKLNALGSLVKIGYTVGALSQAIGILEHGFNALDGGTWMCIIVIGARLGACSQIGQPRDGIDSDRSSSSDIGIAVHFKVVVSDLNCLIVV